MKNLSLLIVLSLTLSTCSCQPSHAQGYYGVVRMLPMMLSPLRQMANGSYRNNNNNNNGQNGQNGNNGQPAYDWRNNYPNGPANYNGGQGANGQQNQANGDVNGQYSNGANNGQSGQYAQPNQMSYGNQNGNGSNSSGNGKHHKHSKNKNQNQTAYQSQGQMPIQGQYPGQNFNQQNAGFPTATNTQATATTAQSSLYGQQLNSQQAQGYGMPQTSQGEQMGPMLNQQAAPQAGQYPQQQQPF